MDPKPTKNIYKRKHWRISNSITLVTLYISLFIVTGYCQTNKDDSSHKGSLTKSEINKLDNTVVSNKCHSCLSDNNENNINTKSEKDNHGSNLLGDFIDTVSEFSAKYVFVNETERKLQNLLEKVLDEAAEKDRYELIEGVEIKAIDSKNATNRSKKSLEVKNEARALFSSYTYEYRLLQKIKNFIDTHIVSINLPKAVGLTGFRSFGLKKFFLPFLIGLQVFKSIILAMFLPSILGSFGKILGKGISSISAASSQASYPPANTGDAQLGYNNDDGNFMGYETNPAATYAYSPDMYGNMDANDVNDQSIDMSRFGAGGQKVSYLPTKNSYYKNQMTTSNNYKIFQKIPASSMILSNYDPFYSPLLSRLDGIFARLGLAPSDTTTEDSMMIGGQTLSDVKLEACREQLICLMYATPAKYAPYSNLVSAQLSRELNELRRPVSDNPEILRFFRYMRAARRGQEGTDCMKAHPACVTNAAPSHTMIAAYHDINKLVTARKLWT